MVDEVTKSEDGFILNAALAAHPMPDDLPDAIVNRAELAEAMGVSENTISKWLTKELPVEQRGTNGMAYQFRLSHCYAWRRWTEALEDQRRAESASAAQQWSLFWRGETPEDGKLVRSAKDIEAEASAQITLMKASQLRGSLVRADAMRALLEDLMVQFANALITLPDYAEREFGLSPDQVDKLEGWTRDTLTEARVKIDTQLVNRSADVVAIEASA